MYVSFARNYVLIQLATFVAYWDERVVE